MIDVSVWWVFPCLRCLQVLQVDIPEGGFSLEQYVDIDALSWEELAQMLERDWPDAAADMETVQQEGAADAQPAAPAHWTRVLADALDGADADSSVLAPDYVPQPLQRSVPAGLSLGAGSGAPFDAHALAAQLAAQQQVPLLVQQQHVTTMLPGSQQVVYVMPSMQQHQPPQQLPAPLGGPPRLGGV